MAEDRSRSLKMSPMEPGPMATGAEPAKPPVHDGQLVISDTLACTVLTEKSQSDERPCCRSVCARKIQGKGDDGRDVVDLLAQVI